MSNKPTIPAAPGTLNTNNTTAQTVSASEALSGTIKLHKVSKTGSYNDLLNKPTIPTALADLTADATHRLVTDTEKSTWNSKANSSDLSNYLPLSGGNVYGTISFDNTTSTVSSPLNYITPITTEGIEAINAKFRVNSIEFAGAADPSNKVIISDGVLETTEQIDTYGIIHHSTGLQNPNYVWTTDGEYSNINDIVPTLSKGTTTGSGNAVTDISVSGHTITLTKGTEFLTTGASSNDILYDPSVSADTSTIGPGLLTTCLEDIDDALDTKQNTSDKVTSISSSSTNTQYPSALAVYNFGTNLVSQLATVYSGSGAPASSLGSNGDIYIKVT